MTGNVQHRTQTQVGMRNTVYYIALVVLGCGLAFGQASEKVLWSFGTVQNDGWLPNGGLMFDKAGNLYGTTHNGGSECNEECGTAFELSPLPDGTWQETIIYNFCLGFETNCGQAPSGGLVADANGNLYGMTVYGGPSDVGTVFELSPPVGGGNWTQTVLWSFGYSDGAFPYGKLTWDKSGNLYGTTSEAEGSAGTVFELSPSPAGWTEKVLYGFKGPPDDGGTPMAGVTFDKSGNLYGTTEYGGCCSTGWGTVYELSPSPSGWTETVLHRFVPPDGYPQSVVNFDTARNLYGTYAGGTSKSTSSCGGVFRMSPTQQGGWKNYSAFAFNNSGTDGCTPLAAVLVDSADEAVYGTTAFGGPYGSLDVGGTAFEITERGETILYAFCQLAGCADGDGPNSFLTFNAGNYYGTTLYGGTGSACGELGSCGVVFQITPEPGLSQDH